MSLSGGDSTTYSTGSKKEGLQERNGFRSHNADVTNSYASELEQAAMSEMVYNSHFTEDISEKMRIPEKLTVARDSDSDSRFQAANAYNHTGTYRGAPAYNMEVPERIVVSVGEEGVRYGRSDPIFNENYEASHASNEFVSLTTPPRKLTLAERNLDGLDIPETRPSKAGDAIQTQKARPRSLASSSSSSVTMDQLVPAVQQHESIEELDDISLLRRQVFKLHRRITSIEKQQAEKSKRDMYVYAVTIAFWLFNGWFLYGSRRPY